MSSNNGNTSSPVLPSPGVGEMLKPQRFAIKFNPPRFILEYTDDVKTRLRTVGGLMDNTHGYILKRRNPPLL